MILCDWDELPERMQTEEVKPYYDFLKRKSFSLFIKRLSDIVLSFLLLVILSPVYLILAIVIKCDSKGPVFYRQVRITQYGREFRIHKFRSMVVGADRGTLVTVGEDARITRVGQFIRKCRLDEIAQLLDVITGKMTFVGVRPEVPRYVEHYTPEMMATLLLPAGITNLTSIYYSGESDLLDRSENPEKTYVEEVLPGKMKWNLEGIEKFSLCGDVIIMFQTVYAVIKTLFSKRISSADTFSYDGMSQKKR